MEADDLSWRFDVMTKYPYPPTWRVFCLENFPHVSGSFARGVHEIPDMHERDATEWMQSELDEAISDIASFFHHEQLLGVRIVVWRHSTAEGQPDMILEASRKQLQLGKVQAAGYNVAHQEERLHEARGLLRRVIADGVGEADDETVFTEAKEHLREEDLAPYLAGARVLRRALHRARDVPSPGNYQEEDHRDFLESGENFYWHDRARFGLALDGTVRVQVCSDAGDEVGRPWSEDPVEDARLQQEALDTYAAIARSEAEKLVEELKRQGLELRGEEGMEAGVEELARGRRLIVRA